MLEKFLQWSIRFFDRPKTVLLAALVVTVVFAAGLPSLKLDNDLINSLPDNLPAKRDFDRYEELFGSNSVVFIALQREGGIYDPGYLAYVQDLSRRIAGLNAILPVRNVAALLDPDEDQARQVIDAIDMSALFTDLNEENRDAKMDELAALLGDSQTSAERFFWDEDFARLIAGRVRKIDAEELYRAWLTPIEDVNSVLDMDYIHAKKDTFIVEKLFSFTDSKGNAIEQPEFSEKNIAELKRRLESWNLYNGTLVSYRAPGETGTDADISTILVRLNRNIGITWRQTVNRGIMDMLQKDLGTQTTRSDGNGGYTLVKSSAGEVTDAGQVLYLVSGDPVINDEISDSMKVDISFLFPFVALVIIFTLLFSFKNPEGVIYPMISVLLSTLWAMGLMAWCGVPINLVSTTMPVMLIATGSAYGIHLLNSYFSNPATSRLEALRLSVVGVGLPIIMAGLTTVAGFGSNVTSQIEPIRNFGIFTAVGIFFALVVTLWVLPSIMVLIKRPKRSYAFAANETRHDWLYKLLHALAGVVTRRPWFVGAGALAVLVAFLFGMTRITVDMNNVGYFLPDANIYVADGVLNQRLAGTGVLSYVIETPRQNGVLEPEVLQKIDECNSRIAAEYPYVRKTLSINDFLKKMNCEMHGGKQAYDRLPDTAAMARDYMLLYSGDLGELINVRNSYNGAYNNATRVTMTLQRQGDRQTEAVEKFCRRYWERENADFMKQHDLRLNFTNFGHLTVAGNKLVVRGQIRSILTSVALVALLLFVIFRNPGLSFVALLPIVFGIGSIFGSMGLFGIQLNSATSLAASIATGVGIDYAIHFTSRYRSERRRGLNVDAAITETTVHTGRAIFYNIVSVTLGFLVLQFSAFLPIINFSSLLSISMLGTGFGSLLVIPVTLKIFDTFKSSKKEEAVVVPAVSTKNQAGAKKNLDTTASTAKRAKAETGSDKKAPAKSTAPKSVSKPKAGPAGAGPAKKKTGTTKTKSAEPAKARTRKK